MGERARPQTTTIADHHHYPKRVNTFTQLDLETNTETETLITVAQLVIETYNSTDLEAICLHETIHLKEQLTHILRNPKLIISMTYH